jgi:transketolase
MRKTCLDQIYQLAKRDPRVVFIGSDLGSGVLDVMKQEMPERWFMEGVSEQHIIGMAAGLAMEGFIPYVNTIASFLTRRCYEQLVVDLCLHNLSVRLVGNGGGAVYAPLGPTHLATEDLAILRCVPNITIVSPCDAEEMKRLMQQSIEWPGPIYIRLAKGGDKVVSRSENGFEIGKAILLREAHDVLFVTTGVMTQRALVAADKLSDQGIEAGILHMHTIKPFDDQAFIEAVAMVKLVVTAEEHTLVGGLGSLILEKLNDSNAPYQGKVLRIGIPDVFSTEYGSQDSLLKTWKLDSDTLVERVMGALTC